MVTGVGMGLEGKRSSAISGATRDADKNLEACSRAEKKRGRDPDSGQRRRPVPEAGRGFGAVKQKRSGTPGRGKFWTRVH